MNRKGLERTLATRLNPVSRAWQQLADQALSQLGVSNSTGWCMVWLNRLGEDVRQADLARAIGITEASLVRILHQLEASDLVLRQASPDDRRVNHLLLTSKGQALAGEIEETLVNLREDLLTGLPSQDIAATLRVLDHLAGAMAERRQ
ncbi:MarR family winged helix-turn-helix transcriptional regulator [Sphingobium aromaticiconvertens]|uniref:MarR family winged helix-turn-helix transcriptional regulator n=1 Tax=Sphingobium aromaticiconvertens TaxID=365341 RepID=UPI0030165B8D